jgi:hypothetical protein
MEFIGKYRPSREKTRSSNTPLKNPIRNSTSPTKTTNILGEDPLDAGKRL